jgi:hypothetical protein
VSRCVLALLFCSYLSFAKILSAPKMARFFLTTA